MLISECYFEEKYSLSMVMIVVFPLLDFRYSSLLFASFMFL